MMFEAIGWANRVKRSKNVCNAHALFSPNEFHAHQYIRSYPTHIILQLMIINTIM